MSESTGTIDRNILETVLEMTRIDPLGDLDQRLPFFEKRFRETIARTMFDKVIGSVDRDLYKSIQQRHADAVKAGALPALNKFLDVPAWVRAHALLAEEIGLLSLPSGRVLDIGSGGGHLLAVCKAYGHDPLGLDVPNALYAELFQMYGIARIEEGVTFGVPLPARCD